MDPIEGRASVWSPRTRVVAGVLSGFGATGAMFGTLLLGRFIDIDTPFDVSGIIMVVPLVVIASNAGAVLRGRLAVAAITTGATGAPIVAIGLMKDGCAVSGFVAIGLAFFAMLGLVVGGLSAYAGTHRGQGGRSNADPRLRLALLIAISLVGVVGWAATLPVVSCP